MKFRPLHDRVVIRRAEGDTKSKGGIIIPDTAKERPQEGEVVAVGPGSRDESGKLMPLDVRAGDTVLFGKWSGTEVKLDGEDLLIMKETDIMGIVEKVAAVVEKPKAAAKSKAAAKPKTAAKSKTLKKAA
jgi:chaperonin GroES